MNQQQILLTECPRDAMQGFRRYIDTEDKLRYLQALLAVGFDTLDFGSFVSPKAIPQMRDTHQVIQSLDTSNTQTKLLAIIANERGANEAVQYQAIHYLGYPFSVSETFQLRNTNASIEESFDRVKAIQEICIPHNKQLVVYLSMAFGNPYGDPWSADILAEWSDKMCALGIKKIALSDTIGVAHPETIKYLFSTLIPQYPDLEFGAHFHTLPNSWEEKIQAAVESGCKRFDGAIKGFGGCPMAKDDLTGNMPTEHIIAYADNHGLKHTVDRFAFFKAMKIADQIFLDA